MLFRSQQLKLIRAQAGAGGSLQWSFRALHQNRDGLADKLLRQINTTPALVPASPWLDATVPERPVVAFGQDAGRTVSVFQWGTPSGTAPAWWLLQQRVNGVWQSELLPGAQTNRTLKGASVPLPELLAVTAISRVGHASPPFVAQRAG